MNTTFICKIAIDHQISKGNTIEKIAIHCIKLEILAACIDAVNHRSRHCINPSPTPRILKDDSMAIL